MAKVYEDDIIQITAKFNGETDGPPYGFTEQYLMRPGLTDAQILARGLKLVQLRSRMLAKDISIPRVIASSWKNPNKTLKINTAPILSPWAGGQDTSPANMTLSPANLTIGGTQAVAIDNEMEIDNPDTTILFRLETELRSRGSRHIHGVPDAWVTAFAGENLNASIEWYDDDASPAEPSVGAASVDYWTNFKDFWTYYRLFCVQVYANDGLDGGNPPAAKPYQSELLSRVIFEKVSKKKVGAPFGLLRGRAA